MSAISQRPARTVSTRFYLERILASYRSAISNFFFRIDAQWLTPKLDCGVLPGIQREFLLRNLDGAEECELEIRDILRADRIFACNALRGIRVVHSFKLQIDKPFGSKTQVTLWMAKKIALHAAT